MEIEQVVLFSILVQLVGKKSSLQNKDWLNYKCKSSQKLRDETQVMEIRQYKYDFKLVA